MLELHERISLILKENNMKQKQLAEVVEMTESYISALLSRRSGNPSKAFAKLIEEKLGYSAEWVLSGKEPKLITKGRQNGLTDAHKRVIFQVEKMSEDRLKATLAFIHSLDKLESLFVTK